MDSQISFGPVGGPVHGAAVSAGSAHFMSLQERRVIEYGLTHSHTYAQIGAGLGRDNAVVWREVNCNRCADGTYLAAVAEWKAYVAR